MGVDMFDWLLKENKMSYNALNNTINFGRSQTQNDFTTQIQSDELQDNRPSVEDWAEYIEWLQENE